MTGTSTLFGVAAAQADTAELVYLGSLLVAFVLGAAASGLIIGDSGLQLGRRYGVALTLESVLLWLAVPLLHRHNDAGLWLAAAACGLQNAMAGTFSGAVVRTTHMSGIVTDLGAWLGQWMRRSEVDMRRVRLYLVLFLGFTGGGVAAAVAFPVWQERSLMVPAALTGITGVGYALYRHWHPPQSHTSE